MSDTSYDRIPELAGLATYAGAARVGYSVDENVRRLLRYHWVERRLMSILIARLPGEPVWELKCGFALHQWQGAERVDAIRHRIAEMRNPVPRLDASPDRALDPVLDDVLRAPGTTELLANVYVVLLPAMLEAYVEHAATTNPLVDQPTRRLMLAWRSELEEQIEWGRRALEALTGEGEGPSPRSGRQVADVDGCCARTSALLAAAGGVAGNADSERPGGIATPGDHAASPPPDLIPRRDERFAGQYNFVFPPHVAYTLTDLPADERNLALLCRRTLEMDVPEMMASFMTERASEPWEFYRDYSRQLWDEARHAMMGSVALEARGIDWKHDVPLNVSFALRLGQHATPLERQMMLFAIEQSLMPADTGKRYEYETALAAGDELSAHFHDYDWADEVLHAQIGRRALKRDGISADEARAKATEVHERTWAALEQYRDRDEQSGAWWPALVKRALGRDSATPAKVTAGAGVADVLGE